MKTKDTFNSYAVQAALTVSCVFALAGCTGSRENVGTVPPAAAAVERVAEPNELGDRSPADLLAEQWGVKVERVVLSAGGYLVDFRYRILDAAKATPILNRSTRPYLIDQATDARFIVPSPPKLGPLRSGGQVREDTVYFILFANPGKYIKSGNKVTVVVGDFEARDIVVQ